MAINIRARLTSGELAILTDQQLVALVAARAALQGRLTDSTGRRGEQSTGTLDPI
jgi:hypothetical protein